MIAHVAPFRRMPNHLNELSYLVPEELEPRIMRGSIVEIPLRGTPIIGLVMRMENISDASGKLKSLSKHLGVDVPEPYVATLERAAEYFAVTVPYLADALLPAPPKRWKETLTPIKPHVSHFKNERRLIELGMKSEETDALMQLADETKHAGEALHIIVPGLDQTGLIADIFDGRYRVAVATSEVTPAKLWSIFVAGLRGEIDVLITTRRGVLFPFANLGRTVILDEESSDHKQWDMKPRYDARTIAELRAEETQTGLIALSSAPRLTTRASFTHQTALAHIPTILVHTNHDVHHPFSQPTLDAIEDAQDANKKIVIVSEVPVVMPSELSLLVPQSVAAPLPEADLVVAIFPDRMLQANEWSAEERMHASMLQLSKRMRPDATLIIVATTAHRAFAGLLPSRRDEYYAKLLAERKEYDYPPFGSFVKLIIQSIMSMKDALAKATALEAQLKSPRIEFLGPYPSDPPYVRGRHRALILLKGTKEAVEDIKSKLLALPDEVLVDIDPDRIFR